MATQKNFLTDEEAVALDRIATKSKMDCWFSIRTYGDGDFIYDLENGKVMALEDGIGQLTEGIVDGPEFYGLTYDEVLALNYLFEVLELPFRFTEFNGKQVNYNLKYIDDIRRRVRRELEEYERHLKGTAPEEIIRRSYETVVKTEMVQIIENSNYSPQQIKGLLVISEPNILRYLYRKWLDLEIQSPLEIADLVVHVADEGYAAIKREEN